jgi:hypothetical protein
MTLRMTNVPVLIALALGVPMALAQQPAAPAMATVPQHTCMKPELPGAFADSRRFDRFNKEGKAYSDCIKKFVDETKAVSDANIEAGNKAINEYNAFAKEVEERQAAVKK